MQRSARTVPVVALAAILVAAPLYAAPRTFEAGSLIVPMDLTYQDSGTLQAYGLLFQLLRQGVPVYWVIDPAKTWHHSPCDTPGDECAWDCADEGSGVKCPYPTASPDFFASAQVVWDSEGTALPGDTIATHGYRGGPFVIDAADRDRALVIIDVWNDNTQWGSNPWASRSTYNVVTVHETTSSFTGDVRKEMVAAPTIAVFSDGNEDIATGYLRAAGIAQSNGNEFPAARCNGDCGPNTANPDMLTVPSIMGDMGTCDAVNYDHKNGALFTEDGLPAYCQIMSMHWNVGDRETVECNGGGCPATEAQCAGETITYHGHEVVAEVRQFLNYPVHFFAECQAVNAYENTVPNPDWPFLDDPERLGHFLTTRGTPPACPCTDGDFECVIGGCGGSDCCLPRDIKELGAGFMIAAQPNSNTLQILHPHVPYNQLDGAFQTIGGSEPAYNLSAYLGTEYINNLDVTFITGANGPGDQDVWMSGFLDGACDIIVAATGLTAKPEIAQAVRLAAGATCNTGKVSYLGGHRYATNTPISASAGTQGARLFLNALFEADCVTSVGQPGITVSLDGELLVGAQSFPVERDYSASFVNGGRGVALDGVLAEMVPASVEVVAFQSGGTAIVDGVEWPVGAISADPPLAGDPPNTGSRTTTLRFADFGDYDVEVRLSYRVGLTERQTSQIFTIQVLLDSDGDRIPDLDDPAPSDPFLCGDRDGDTCDDCAVTGTSDPGNDGPDSDGDGICDAGEGPGVGGNLTGRCGCASVGGSSDGALWLLVFVTVAIVLRRRRSASSQSDWQTLA